MASKDIWFSLQDLQRLDDEHLRARIRVEVGQSLIDRANEVLHAAKATFANNEARGGGTNGITVMVPVPPAKGSVLAAWGSKPEV